MGTSTAGADTTERAYRAFLDDGVFPSQYDFLRQHTFGAVLHVVAELAGVRGPAWMVSTACTSSAKPFASAQRLFAAGLADAAIVGGIDTLCSMTLCGFQSLQALDRQACRPFHRDRAGISIGEGGALVLLERHGDARVLLEGVGESSDAWHVSAPHPEGAGARAAMIAALAQAGRVATDVDHVNAHGTGTRLNDSAEAKAIASVFGSTIPVISTKGYTGHTLGGAGATEFVFAAAAIEEGWIPASLHAHPVDPQIGVHVPGTVTRGRFRRVLSNTFAFGGNNVSLLLGEP
jgi:3-oxoacyl-[acyl-carrier-protein] synthase-1